MDVLEIVSYNLKDPRLVKEVTKSGPRPKTFLVVTEKGKKVAEKIREIRELLSE